MAFVVTLVVTKCPDTSLALTNKVYLNREDFQMLTRGNPQRPFLLLANAWVYSAEYAHSHTHTRARARATWTVIYAVCR